MFECETPRIAEARQTAGKSNLETESVYQAGAKENNKPQGRRLAWQAGVTGDVKISDTYRGY